MNINSSLIEVNTGRRIILVRVGLIASLALYITAIFLPAAVVGGTTTGDPIVLRGYGAFILGWLGFGPIAASANVFLVLGWLSLFRLRKLALASACVALFLSLAAPTIYGVTAPMIGSGYFFWLASSTTLVVTALFAKSDTPITLDRRRPW